MATYTSTAATKHVTSPLAANTTDTVTLDQPYPIVEIENRDGTNGLYVWLARGTSDTIPTITPGMDGTWYVAPGAARRLIDDAATLNLPTKIAVTAAGSIAEYHVSGIGR